MLDALIYNAPALMLSPLVGLFIAYCFVIVQRDKKLSSPDVPAAPQA